VSYFLDTDICIFALKGQFASLKKSMESLAPEQIKIPSIVKAELLLGAYQSRNFNEIESVLKRFLEPFEIVPFEDACTEFYANIRADLEKKMEDGDKKEILAALANRGMLGFFMAVFWMIIYLGGKLLSALFIAGLGMNFKAILRMNMPFGDIYKLSIRALSLGMVLDAMLSLSGIDFPYFFILYYLMAASYLWLGMKAVSDEDMTAAGLKV